MTIEDLALLFIRGIGSRTATALIEHFGSAEELFAASLSEIKSSIGLREELARRIVSGEGMQSAEREVEYCRKHDIRIISSTDEEYPEALREVSDRPHVLFVQGDVRTLKMRTLSVVGTRDASPAGIHNSQLLVSTLADKVDDLCIVSGLAYGIDAAAHRAALAAGAKTIAVVPSILPSITPASHQTLANEILRSGGAIVSELHSQTHHNGSFFISRNRIIAGISEGTVVIESPATGGSLATADIADSYSRVVMATPGRMTDSNSFGSNNLIRTGKARLVLSAEDIIEDLGWSVTKRKEQTKDDSRIDLSALSHPEQRIVEAFNNSSEVDWESLINNSGLSLGELSMAMMDLEIKGIIRALPGKRYELI